MAGIYLHIPFCKQACTYCDFHFSTNTSKKTELLEAMRMELLRERAYLENEPVNTIYFGGGTPSLVEANEISRLLDEIQTNYSISNSPEITLEANPDDITVQRLGDWSRAGINRISLGVQSFHDDDLRWMNRSHGARQALDSIEAIQKSAITNISIDLIYGYPLLTNEKWEQNLDQAIALGVPHLSCYSMTVEDKTVLAHQIKKGLGSEMDEDQAAAHFTFMQDHLEAAGYAHYEISNFSLPGKQSIHNTNYWKGEKYLGIGPSAHSYNGTARRSNLANNSRYVDAIQNSREYFQTEMLTETERFNEFMLISLRTSAGFNMPDVYERFGKKMQILAQSVADRLLKQSLLSQQGTDCFFVPRNKKLLSDYIIAQFVQIQSNEIEMRQNQK